MRARWEHFRGDQLSLIGEKTFHRVNLHYAVCGRSQDVSHMGENNTAMPMILTLAAGFMIAFDLLPP
jgi:hypothetical protein